MADVFDAALRRENIPDGERELLRDAYARALSALEICGRAERRSLAQIVIALGRADLMDAPGILAALAVKEYLAAL